MAHIIAVIGATTVFVALVVLLVSSVLTVIATVGSIYYRKVAKENDSVGLIFSRLGNYFVSFAVISTVLFTNILLMVASTESGVSVPVNYAIFGVGWYVLALVIPWLKHPQSRMFTRKSVLLPLILTTVGIGIDLGSLYVDNQPSISYSAVQFLVLYAFLAPNAKFPLFRWGYTKLPE